MDDEQKNIIDAYAEFDQEMQEVEGELAALGAEVFSEDGASSALSGSEIIIDPIQEEDKPDTA